MRCKEAAFYDSRHLASHLILEYVVCLDTLVSAMASTVDQAIVSQPLIIELREFFMTRKVGRSAGEGRQR
jgi:hypothetical protein